jgi:hypothetical protein
MTPVPDGGSPGHAARYGWQYRENAEAKRPGNVVITTFPGRFCQVL